MEHQDRQKEDIKSYMQTICPALSLQDASRSVTDADEEIFLLYTLSAPPVDRQGLGQVDGRHDRLAIAINLSNVSSIPIVSSNDSQLKDRSHPYRTTPIISKKKKGNDFENARSISDTILTITIRQDSTSIRSTIGDTGSVVWRSSVYFAAKVLYDFTQSQRHIVKAINREPEHFLLSPFRLEQIRILELGSGTGILPALILSHNLFSNDHSPNLHWIASDQEKIISLLRKNVKGLSKGNTIASTSTLDWLDASRVYQNGSSSSRQSVLKDILLEWLKDDQTIQWPDIIFATDCIFNPHLFIPFLDTLTLFSQPKQTLIYVICELRQADMMQEFLQSWLDHPGSWTIYTIESVDILGPHLSKGSVVWVAWRTK